MKTTNTSDTGKSYPSSSAVVQSTCYCNNFTHDHWTIHLIIHSPSGSCIKPI
jgi:hypothetical protein